jgi:hypothetical protein
MTAHRQKLYVALEDGVVEMSRDGGRTWAVMARPRA